MQRIRLKREPDLTLKHQGFAHQLEAVNAIQDLEYAALFHEQGLGKTKVAIDLIVHWLSNRVLDTVMVIVKKGLINNWQTELEAHSELVPRVLTTNRNNNFFVLNSPARIVLAHYEAVKLEKSRLELYLTTRSVGAILDESTKIKNPDAALTNAFLDLAPQFKRRVIMSGTPVSNRPQDIWSQIKFLDGGGALGDDYAAFKRSVNLSNELDGDLPAQHEFETQLGRVYESIGSFTVRETKASVELELPDKVIKTIVSEWEPRQYDLYRQVRESLRAVVFRDGQLVSDDSEVILKRLLRLVQIASHPVLVDPSYQTEPGKFEVLLEIVASVVQKGEKCLIWTSFVDNVFCLADLLSRHNPQVVHGRLTTEDRNRAVRTFLSDPTATVFVATPGSAKEGLTLTVANHVIFYDRLFSLDDYLQAQDRIHRISQQRTCYVYNLIMRDSIDEWVEAILRSKHVAAQLAQGDIDHEAFAVEMSYEFGNLLKTVLEA